MDNAFCKEPEILVIDDAPEQIHIIVSILKKENYKVRALVDGKQAIQVLEQMNIDLILLDIMMPEISGIELCKTIKRDPRYCSIPIVFLTAISESDTIVDAFSAGAQDYVSKPVNPKELLARVNLQLQLKNKTEKLEIAYKEIENFNHMVCHDLKSPLWAIKSLIGFLNDEFQNSSDSESKHFLLRLNEKATDAIMLIEKLSELSKATSEPLLNEKIKIDDLVRDVVDTLVNENKKRSIEVEIPQLPDVIGDKLLLRQVFYNVLSNAFKYTRKRKCARIKVNYQQNGSEYLFCIIDNGSGFNMEYSSRLFQMFQRMHTKKEFEGTGTGLAISKKIIERHGGKIWIYSEEEKGTSVYFTLPA